MTDKKDIRDDEFRVIGGHNPGNSTGDRRQKRLSSVVALLILAAFCVLTIWKWPRPTDPDEGIFDHGESAAQSSAAPLGMSTDSTWTEKIDTSINDVHLSLYIPHNSTPVLTLGAPSGSDIILAAQAADIRADNGKILGAFVLEGKPLAWGLSKKGYCAIIEGDVTIGKSDNSPLFEEATGKDGYFFRQYPLVYNGELVDNEPKGKSMRKALCSRAGELFIAVSETDESFHDFAQALVDMGVENAIYLVGGRDSGGWWLNGKRLPESFAPEATCGKFKNETYIVWRTLPL